MSAYRDEHDRLAVVKHPDDLIGLGADADALAAMFDTVLTGLAGVRSGELPYLSSALSDVTALLARLEGLREALTRAAAGRASHGELAHMLGLSRSGAQHLRRGIADGPSAAELWATGERVPVDHPGAKVPEYVRSWSKPWPAYLPVDITPPELRLDEGLSASVIEGWAEPAPTPHDIDISEWLQRQRDAVVPFDCDDRWWPLNPKGRTGRTGRNLGRWGENAAADPIVVAGAGAERHALLIRRSDCGQWAIPGGMVDPGETAPAALVRELREETGVDLADIEPVILARVHVDDPRETDHAWVATTAALYRVPERIEATAADDADDARWLRFADMDTLAAELAAIGGELYEAHRPLLSAAQGHLGRN